MFPPYVAQIHQQKNFPILETHWLALSMLMAIFARGGLGRVDGQCSNSEVSSGWCPAGSAAFASLVFFRPTPLGFRQVVQHVQLHVA